MTAIAPIAAAAPLAVRRCLISNDSASTALLAAAANSLGWAAPEVTTGGILAALPAIEHGPPPALIIVDLDTEADPLAALAALADHCLAQTQVLAIGSANDVALFRALRDAGVSDYLAKPLAMADITTALARVAPDAATPIAATTGRLLVVLGARGGCGATAVATSLAFAIAERQRSILVDLDLHFGSAGLVFGLEPAAGLAAILATPDRLDEQLVAAALQPAGPRLGVIASNLSLEQPASIDRQAAIALLAMLCSTADWVVADLPRGLDALARDLLRTADTVVLVAPPDLAGLRDAARLMAYLTALRAGAPPLLVVNGLQDGLGLGRHDCTANLAAPVAAWIPALPGAALAAAAHGRPIGSVAGDRNGNPFDALAAQITGNTAAAARKGWWPWRR